jgi:hypothetical protein
VLAFALDVALINLILPVEDEDVQVAGRTVASSATLRGWVVGEHPLGGPDGGQDPRIYFSEVPAWEFRVERIAHDDLKRDAREAEREGNLAKPPRMGRR